MIRLCYITYFESCEADDIRRLFHCVKGFSPPLTVLIAIVILFEGNTLRIFQELFVNVAIIEPCQHLICRRLLSM